LNSVFTAQLTIGQPEIVAPYDFGSQLPHYVIAPEVREGQTLIEIIRLSSGDLAKVDVQSRGAVDAPRIELMISSREPLCTVQMEEVHERVSWHLTLQEDLRPFYTMAAGDPVLSASIDYNFGAKANVHIQCPMG
jgi:hypothetical protein